MYDPDKAINEQYEEIQRLEVLQTACIEFYCGIITKEEWRQAVRESPEGRRLIALANLYGVK